MSFAQQMRAKAADIWSAEAAHPFVRGIGDGSLEPVSAVDAFGPDIDPRGAWYDELLVSGDTAVVIGYSYARGGTEIGLFEISDAGRLSYRATYHLRSNDYYSSRNYASRLIGSKLVFYTPLRLNPFGGEPWGAFPAMRRWRPGASAADFRPIAQRASRSAPMTARRRISCAASSAATRGPTTRC